MVAHIYQDGIDNLGNLKKRNNFYQNVFGLFWFVNVDFRFFLVWNVSYRVPPGNETLLSKYPGASVATIHLSF